VGTQRQRSQVADYGITVENAPNAVFAWQGTILHEVRPGDLGTDFRQCGLGFAMSRQLGKLLERFGTGTSTSTSTTAVPVEINDEQELFVDAVWDSRMNGGELEYLIKWTGEDEPGREPAVDVNELEAIDRFHEAYPNKPGPLSEDYEDEIPRWRELHSAPSVLCVGLWCRTAVVPPFLDGSMGCANGL
jgi:hypothetical protein